MISTFQNFLFESKQVNTLYHFTDLVRGLLILQSDMLKPSDESQYGTIRTTAYNKQELNTGFAVCFTRNKLYFKGRNFKMSGENSFIRIMIDGTKLSHKYKVEPFFHYNMYSNTYEDKEQEERIYMKSEEDNLRNIKSYIMQIDIFTKFKPKDLVFTGDSYNNSYEYWGTDLIESGIIQKKDYLTLTFSKLTALYQKYFSKVNLLSEMSF